VDSNFHHSIPNSRNNGAASATGENTSMKDQETIIFRGVVLKHFDGRQSPDGATFFTRMNLSAEFSDTVRENMDWDDPGDCIKPGSPAKLTGELLGHNFILTPGDKRLKDKELQLGIKDVTDFQVITLKDDEGEPSGRQLRFQVRTEEDGAAALCEQYVRSVGRHEGQLKISYIPQPKQEPLPLGDTSKSNTEVDVTMRDGTPATLRVPAREKNCVDCANGVAFMKGDDTVHASGQPCTKKAPPKPKEPALASAREATGGTHQRKTPTGPVQ